MSLTALERWYANRCEGEWEHSYGIHIETLDNPGWRLDIDLRGTNRDGGALDKIQIDRSDNDWIHYWVESAKFHIACGPANLSESIDIFVRWFEGE